MAYSKFISIAVNNAVSFVCVYFTGVCLFMYTIVHSHELAYTVKEFYCLLHSCTSHGITPLSGKPH